MHRFILIFVCLINSVTSSTDSTQIPSVDTSSFVQSSSTDPTSIQFTTSLSSVHRYQQITLLQQSVHITLIHTIQEPLLD
ncbi:hypothetical protein I4U23_030037 [Adineta vaga]|nr:hypothetical protein I4U23_030037 [Adineta vaga]